jgi:dipeptidase D
LRILEIFNEITSIPRCSGKHEPFKAYMIEFAAKNGYICDIDSANNILCYKKSGNPSICLQSHYDIVCLEDGKIPQIIEEDGYLKAKDSTLGADNGIGCSYMLALMEENQDIECLFTCDEEIGLLGANGISIELKSKYMLNLDSEEEGHICIGCAGGIDIFATNKTSNIISNKDDKQLYEVAIGDLDGGHSGVDIDKNIPNAIKLLTSTIKQCNGELLEIQGGERINSIPKSAKALIVSLNTPISINSNMVIKKVDTQTEHYKVLDDRIVHFLHTFAHGVRGYDKELDVVLSSINLAKVTTDYEKVTIELSARSMDNDELKILTTETVSLLEYFGFDVTTSGKYPAWKPTHSDFTIKVQEIYKKHSKDVSIDAIHAGLECAIFKQKYPNMEICSIGPNIYFPHSHREKCEISSVHNVYKIVKDIVNTL